MPPAAGYGGITLGLVRNACLQTLQITSMILMIAVCAAFFTIKLIARGAGTSESRRSSPSGLLGHGT